MLCRAAGVDVRYAIAENRLAAPATGPLSLATHFTQPVAWIADGKTGTWLTLGNKFAPFGYLPAEVRGMPAYWLDGSGVRVVLPSAGDADTITFSGKGSLDAQGDLTIELTEEFAGKLGAAVRQGLSQVPERQLATVLESNLLAQAFRGGELQHHSIEYRDDRDHPLVVRMTAKVRRFAQLASHALVIVPPLSPDLGRLVTLPSRANPLLIGEGVHRKLRIAIELPKGARVELPAKAELVSGERKITVADSNAGATLLLERTVDLPAGRVSPKEYPEFARFAHGADDALSRVIRVALP
jgi:hypothetical protein